MIVHNFYFIYLHLLERRMQRYFRAFHCCTCCFVCDCFSHFIDIDASICLRSPGFTGIALGAECLRTIHPTAVVDVTLRHPCSRRIRCKAWCAENLFVAGGVEAEDLRGNFYFPYEQHMFFVPTTNSTNFYSSAC